MGSFTYTRQPAGTYAYVRVEGGDLIPSATTNTAASRALRAFLVAEGIRLNLTQAQRNQLATAAGTSLNSAITGAGLQFRVKEWVQEQVFSGYTTMLYRTRDTSGRPTPYGEAPALNIAAGGDLTINGSINDGFFSFREQTGVYLDSIITNSGRQQMPFIPYIAGSNAVSPNDFGNTPNATRLTAVGDPFGAMELFPRLNATGNQAASGIAAVSSSLSLTADGDFMLRGTYVFEKPAPEGFTPSPNSWIVSVSPVVRSGSGAIRVAAGRAIDLRGSETPFRLVFGLAGANGLQTGGARIYTSGLKILPTSMQVSSPAGAVLTVVPSVQYTQTVFTSQNIDVELYADRSLGIALLTTFKVRSRSMATAAILLRI
jgi:hypothetical protein